MEAIDKLLLFKMPRHAEHFYNAVELKISS